MAILFFVFLVLLPSQLGKHWWPQWSLVSGVRVDYLSPTLYLTDIILVFLICLALRKNRKSVRDSLKRVFSFTVLFSIFYFLFSIFLSLRPFLSLYSLARYAQILLVAWVTRRVHRRLGVERFWRLTGLGLSIGILWTLMLSAVQIIAGKTVGFWILGERSFTLVTPGIATLSVLGRAVLRPYATFPHPNAMAGFLAVCFLLLTRHSGASPRAIESRFIRLSRSLAGIGVLLSASRLAIASLIMVLLASMALFRTHAIIMFSPQSTEERLVLARATTAMIRDHPLVGVGPGQFLVKLPGYLPRGTWLLQPVHNIPLLLLAEFGIIGSALAAVIFWKFLTSATSRSLLTTHYSLLFFLLLTSLGDHYWMTAQQNRLLLGVVLGLLTRSSSAQQQGVGLSPRLRRTS